MNSKKQFLQFVIFPIFFVLTACGGRSNQKAHQSNGAMPAELESMANQPAQLSSRDMHRQHNSLAENFSHMDIKFRVETR